MKYKKTDKKEGFIVSEDTNTGLKTYEPKNKLTLADLPPQDADEQKQIENLIAFIDEFKNYMDFEHIADVLKFILLPIFQDAERRTRLLDAIEQAKGLEEQEAQEALEADAEATLADIEHNGLALMRETLTDIQGMTPQEIEDTLQQFYRKPPFLSMPNTKLSNFLFDHDPAHDLTKGGALIVSGERSKKEIAISAKVFVSLLEDEDGVKLPQTLTAYDRAVYDGVCSVIANNKDMLATNRQIYEAMTGKATTSPQALGHVTRSLNKMRNTTIYLDITEQAQARGLSLDKMVFDENLLNFVGLEITSSGQTVHGYKFLKVPILYHYAKVFNQIVTVDKSLLDVPVSNTDDSIVLKHYMLRRIEAMKNTKNNIQSKVILFSSMFEYCGISGTDTQMNRKRKVVYDILAAWRDMKYIKDYAECKEGRKISGVEIKL